MSNSKDLIKSDKLLKEFNRIKGGRESTIKAREIRIVSYSNFTGMYPTQLIEEAELEQDNNIKMRKRKISAYLLDYIHYLNAEGKAINTIKSFYSTVKSFYSTFDIDLPKIKPNIQHESTNPAYEELLSKETIKFILKISNIRDKALILLHASSGMGAAEVRNLKYMDFINSIREYLDPSINEFDIKSVDKALRKKVNIIPTWKITRIKTGMPYITFSSPESTLAILDYLIESLPKRKILSEDHPLFITIRGSSIKRGSYTRIYERLNDRARLGYDKEGKRYFKSHKLRKYFASAMMRSGVDKTNIDWMMGHKIDPSSAAYFKTNPNTLKGQYLRGLKEITLEDVEVKQVASKEYHELLRIIKQKDDEIAYLSKRVSLIESLATQEEYKKDVSTD